jgi:hypothetical protein
MRHESFLVLLYNKRNHVETPFVCSRLFVESYGDGSEEAKAMVEGMFIPRERRGTTLVPCE